MNYRHLLLSELKTYLALVMFRCLSDLSQHRRDIKTGFRHVILSAGGERPVIAELQLGVRLDSVERLVYPFTLPAGQDGAAGCGPPIARSATPRC